ncbi:MAG TPA: hypothetical protein VIY52_02020 [Streptosporangiaceae bacterium]
MPRALSKLGDPGALVGSRSVAGTGAFTRGSYRYLYPTKAPAAMTTTVARASHAPRERRLGAAVLAPWRLAPGVIAAAAIGSPARS